MEPSGSKRLVPILPAQQIKYTVNETGPNDHATPNEPSSAAQRAGKRVVVAVACEGCRRKKAKVSDCHLWTGVQANKLTGLCSAMAGNLLVAGASTEMRPAYTKLHPFPLLSKRSAIL
jgi:hypothetical protein